jgi:hypothetical protein
MMMATMTMTMTMTFATIVVAIMTLTVVSSPLMMTVDAFYLPEGSPQQFIQGQP